MRILNLGAGKVDIDKEIGFNDLVVNVDQCYNTGYTISEIEDLILSDETETQLCCKSNIFTFADSFKYKFDKVICERIFEHMEYLSGEVGRLLEAINTLTKPKAQLEIVVPNALLIAKKLQKLEKDLTNPLMNPMPAYFMNDLLIVNSEFHNIRQDPHLSTWTPNIAKFYIEQEGIWNIAKIEPQIEFAGRNIYMRIICIKK